ncbi:MAG: zinc ribbon domain-containing protein [Candidatus Omnitrophica bacterium]|nr:zinc ribbon domain-containing protein [Candidatus Omnitrophota bacterium]
MPTYEYECQHCKHTFELFQKISDKPVEKCPKCAKSVKRLIGSGSGIIFKGAGFYATDYRKPTKNNPVPTCPKAKEGCDGCKHGK